MQQQEQIEAVSEEQDIFDEDYGKMKMEVFKQQCRDILGTESAPPMTQNNDIYDEIPEADPYHATEVVDIVTAYKSLKLAMSKNLRGVAGGREMVTGKGYLKSTMASKQAQRQAMGLPPIGV